MTLEESASNENPDTAQTIPRMMGDTDVDVIKQVLRRLPETPRLVEFGPWLGGVTSILARYGECHVIDRFEWSELNAQRLPGLFEPGANFRPEFERRMSMAGVSPVVHESAFRDFEWSGDPIDFCLIDAPRTGKDLLDCLRPICQSLTDDARVLIKNGANTQRFDFMSDIFPLLAEGFFTVENIGQPKWCNIAVLRPTSKTGDLGSWEMPSDGEPVDFGPADLADPWGGELFLAAHYARVIDRDGYQAAFAILDRQPPRRKLLSDWDVMDRYLAELDHDPAELAYFAAVLEAHNDVPSITPRAIDPGASFPAALAHCWLALSGDPKRPELFKVDAIAGAFLAGAFSAVRQLGADLTGKDVALIGDHLGMFEVAIMASGARSFLGLNVSGDSIGARPILDFGALASAIVPLTGSDIYVREHFDVVGVLDNFSTSDGSAKRIDEIIALKSAKSRIVRISVEHVKLPVST